YAPPVANTKLTAAIDSVADQKATRLRLRSVLRRLIDGIWMAVGNRGRDRLCTLQIHFTGGRTRCVNIMHRGRRFNGAGKATPARWWVNQSATFEIGPDSIDYRDPDQAKYHLDHLLTLWHPEHPDEERQLYVHTEEIP